jgi:hypothetical protein
LVTRSDNTAFSGYSAQIFATQDKIPTPIRPRSLAFEYSAFAVDGRPVLSMVVYNPVTPADADRIKSLIGTHARTSMNVVNCASQMVSSSIHECATAEAGSSLGASPRWLWDLNKLLRAKPRRPLSSATGEKSGQIGYSASSTIRFRSVSPPPHDRGGIAVHSIGNIRFHTSTMQGQRTRLR